MTTSSHPRVPECPLCGGAGRTWFKGPRHVLRCEDCRALYAFPQARSDDEFTEAYYRGGVYSDYLADEKAIRRTSLNRLRLLERHVTGRTLLDVGCAAGFFLEAARERQWSAFGLDISRYATDVARRRGCEVLTGSTHEALSLGRRFSAVTMWDTIEHLDHVDQTICAARRLLDPGGVLALSTGDAASHFARLSGPHWRLLQDPTHRVFFTEPVLKELLQRAQFRVLEVSRPGKWVSAAMMLHHSGIRSAARLGRWCVDAGANPMIYVNLRDVMTVVAAPSA